MISKLRSLDWRRFWIIIGVALAILSLVYTNWLASKMAVEEEKSVALWADAVHRISSDEKAPDANMSFLLEVIKSNTTIPIILTDSTGVILTSANIDYTAENKEEILAKELRSMRHTKPIMVDLPRGEHHLIYYDNSVVLKNITYFPLLQIFIVGLLVSLAFYSFQSMRKLEQENLWIGMSKETAHQLGTPISSLMAWLEILRMEGANSEAIQEIEKDITRLEKIANRFSKIGSKPDLVDTDFRKTIDEAVSYLAPRISNKVNLTVEIEENADFNVPHNFVLLSWVVENLCRNAVDAIAHKGEIKINLQQHADNVVLDVSDTGKGIAKAEFKRVFQPGYTSKKRGWGLGLSLAKRIIEEYHHGRIYVRNSELKKGTTFRIVLNKVVTRDKK